MRHTREDVLTHKQLLDVINGLVREPNNRPGL